MNVQSSRRRRNVIHQACQLSLKSQMLGLSAAWLVVLLQRTPVLRVANIAAQFVAPSRIVSLLKSFAATAASLGAVQSLAGATQFVINNQDVSGTAGIAIAPVAFTVTGASTPAASFRVSGTLPPGLTLSNANASGLLNGSTGTILGTPTAAGSYSISILAYERANGGGNTFGPATIRFTIAGGVPVALAPTISTQPESQHLALGTNATLSVTADGTGLSYQWQKDGTPITGATGSVLTLPNVSPKTMGFYRVTVSSSNGLTESAVATLTVAMGGSSRLVNVSTRGYVPPGGALTPGFVLQGTETKSLVIRAVGPTLGSFGVSGSLVDPVMEVVPLGNSTPLVANDNWGGSTSMQTAFSRVGAFPLVATGSADASVEASLRSVGANGYTVRITSKSASAEGIALAEVYDEDGLTFPVRLVNVSTSGFVGTGEQALVPGFVIGGTAPKQLLIRAVGPGLAQFGVPDTLSNPQISLVPLGREFAIAANDNWGGAVALQDAFARAGAFNLSAGSLDAAVLVRLPPGGYTVVVSGVGGAVGTALVEVYDLDR
jgi:hypothetical protein